MVNVQCKTALTKEETRKLCDILSQFTTEEIAFIIYYYDDLGFLSLGAENNSEFKEIIENEQNFKGSTLGQFKDMLEIIFKAGTGGKKTTVEKIAQKLKKNCVECVSAEEFFILTKAIYTGHPIVLTYLSHVIIEGEVNK